MRSDRFSQIFILINFAYAFEIKELDTKKIAVNFYSEVMRGGYKVVSTAELN